MPVKTFHPRITGVTYREDVNNDEVTAFLLPFGETITSMGISSGDTIYIDIVGDLQVQTDRNAFDKVFAGETVFMVDDIWDTSITLDKIFYETQPHSENSGVLMHSKITSDLPFTDDAVRGSSSSVQIGGNFQSTGRAFKIQRIAETTVTIEGTPLAVTSFRFRGANSGDTTTRRDFHSAFRGSIYFVSRSGKDIKVVKPLRTELATYVVLAGQIDVAENTYFAIVDGSNDRIRPIVEQYAKV